MRTRARATLLSSSIILVVLVGHSTSCAQPPAAAAPQLDDSDWKEACRWQHSPQPAAAAPQLSDSDAKTAATAFWDGKRLYDSGRFEQALARFAHAYRITRDPTLLYNIAQSHRKIGNCREAKRAYEQFRDLAPESPLVALTTEHLATLETICPMTSAPPPAQRSVTVAATSSPSSEQRNVTVAATSEPEIATTKAPTPASPILPEPRWADRASGESSRLAPAPKSVSTSTGRMRWDWIAATAAAGLAAGGTAVGVGLWNHSRQERWRAHDALLEKGNAFGESDQQWAIRQQENDELGKSIERTNRAVVYLGVAGGALLAGSALLFFATWPSSTAPVATQAAPRKIWSVPILVEASRFQVLVQSSF